MNPYEELHNCLFKSFTKLGYRVFDFLPRNVKNPYPFIYLGEQFNTDIPTKTRQLGESALVIHIYNDYHERGKTAAILYEIAMFLYELEYTGHFKWQLQAPITQNMVMDETTNDKLWHGIVQTTIKHL
ncbi:hypothetical protein FHQ08_03470 [Lactobacillus sp. CC-MHH1034]|uniref:DUF3168 domain-containing protein n=1 Tax=Agrilactobacillus fermenti TaxID=2586909 RepID=UPI001E61D0F4|nr:DUF3168 domain-containing protein [Agrilactobacillus fermenti]MCD2255775.1 hypothetical protein [Agrilactobacillus fermenti]